MNDALLLEAIGAEQRKRDRLKAMKGDCEADLLVFIETFWHVVEPTRPLVRGWPLELYCDLLMAAADGHHTRIIYNCPPGFMKSLVLNVFLPAWIWGPCDQPGTRFISASYAAYLTERDNGRMLRLLRDPIYRQLWPNFRVTKEGVGKLENDRTGWKLATSVSGVGTGERGDWILIDDANNPLEVESEAVRSTTNLWLREVMPDRLNDLERGIIVNVQQRTHEQDATGTLSHPEDGWPAFTWVSLPMEYDPLRDVPVTLRWDEDGNPIETWRDPRGVDADGNPLEGRYVDAKGELKIRMGSPLGLADGELAWPARFPPEKVAEQKRVKGPYAFCNPGDAPILMADLSMKRLDQVRVGDEVIGFETSSLPRVEGETHAKRRLAKTVVTAISETAQPVVRITLDSGEVIRCTANHRWFTGRGSSSSTHPLYYEAQVGRALMRVCPPKLPPLTDPEDIRLAGWLSGFFDGEGSAVWHARHVGKGGEERVVSIEPDGVETVYGLTTGTGNYVVWGLASSNSNQYQQLSTVRGGGIIRRDWWKLWTAEDFPNLGTVIASLDTAIKESEEADYTAITVWGAFPQADGSPGLILTGAWRMRGSLAEVVTRTAETCWEKKVDYLLIEDKARGNDVAQEIMRQYSEAQWQTVLIPVNGRGAFSGDKVARLQAVSPLFSGDVRKHPVTGIDEWTGGMIWAPDRSWADEVIAEVAAFPRGAHDDYCFAAGTLIATERGPVPIERINVGDRVITPFGWAAVVAAGQTGFAPVVSRNGLVGTADHPIFSSYGPYRPHGLAEPHELGRLTLCGLIRTILLRSSSSWASLTDGWGESGAATSRNRRRMLAARARRDCTSQSGSTALAGPCRRAMRFTTATAILLTSATAIWIAYQRACIAAYLGRGGAAPRSWPTSTKSGPWQQHGTNPPRDALGIASMWLRAWKRAASRATAYARSAAGLLSPSMPMPSIAGLRVPTACPGVSTIPSQRRDSASPAGSPLSRSGRTHAGAVRSVSGGSPSETGPLVPVFNLTVDGPHCYYANGILVHNCDTVSMAVSWVRRHGVVLRKAEHERDELERRKFKRTPELPYAIRRSG